MPISVKYLHKTCATSNSINKELLKGNAMGGMRIYFYLCISSRNSVPLIRYIVTYLMVVSKQLSKSVKIVE